jgi:hypothetical protein
MAGRSTGFMIEDVNRLEALKRQNDIAHFR